MTWRLRLAAPYIALAALLFSIVAGRTLVEASNELNAGKSALARGDVPEAVRKLRRAAHWYLPASPSCRQAYALLEEVATQAESQGRTEHALAAWRAIRASSLATRWLIVPEQPRLARANRHLAALMSELPPPPEDQDKSRARLREEHLALLSEDRAPDPAWIVVMLTGFALWLAAAFWGARNAWDEQDHPRPRALATAGGLVVLGLCLFVLGIARA
jgi:hypothetical protein